MNKRLGRWIAYGVVGIGLFGAWRWANAYDGAIRPPELEVLNAIVGTWEGEFAVNTAPPDNKVTMTAEWILGNRFVLAKSRSTNQTNESETMILWTYDEQQKAYRRWFFLTGGGTFQEWGQWEPASKTFRFKGSDATGPVGEPVPFPDRSTASVGSRTNSTVTITGPDSKEWRIEIRNPEGGVIAAHGTNRRKK